jgi:hypothetical protein
MNIARHAHLPLFALCLGLLGAKAGLHAQLPPERGWTAHEKLPPRLPDPANTLLTGVILDQHNASLGFDLPVVVTVQGRPPVSLVARKGLLYLDLAGKALPADSIFLETSEQRIVQGSRVHLVQAMSVRTTLTYGQNLPLTAVVRTFSRSKYKQL